MAKPLSFNMWITDTDNGHFLAPLWQSRPGRLTRESVEKRTQTEYGCAPGVGYAAWDSYLAASLTAALEQPRLPGV